MCNHVKHSVKQGVLKMHLFKPTQKGMFVMDLVGVDKTMFHLGPIIKPFVNNQDISVSIQVVESSGTSDNWNILNVCLTVRINICCPVGI